jgi:hypothetical protein
MNKEFYENKFYIHNGTEQQGPFTIEELKLQNIDLSTPIWFEGLNDWSTVGEIEELKNMLHHENKHNIPNQTLTSTENSFGDDIHKTSRTKLRKIEIIVLLSSICSLILSFYIKYYFSEFYGFSTEFMFLFFTQSIIALIDYCFLIIGLSALVYIKIRKRKLEKVALIGLMLILLSIYSLFDSILDISSNLFTIVFGDFL